MGFNLLPFFQGSLGGLPILKQYNTRLSKLNSSVRRSHLPGAPWFGPRRAVSLGGPCVRRTKKHEVVWVPFVLFCVSRWNFHDRMIVLLTLLSRSSVLYRNSDTYSSCTDLSGFWDSLLPLCCLPDRCRGKGRPDTPVARRFRPKVRLLLALMAGMLLTALDRCGVGRPIWRSDSWSVGGLCKKLCCFPHEYEGMSHQRSCRTKFHLHMRGFINQTSNYHHTYIYIYI